MKDKKFFKIIKTLKYIRKYCYGRSCNECVFRDRETEKCELKNIPCHWNILNMEKLFAKGKTNERD